MPRIIPIQGSSIPTNVTPGLGAAVGSALSNNVAPLLQQQADIRFEEEKFRLAEEERRQKQEAIDAVLDKHVWRQQFEFDVRRNHDPEDYLDAFDAGEEDYDSQRLEGRSQTFIEHYKNNDKLNRIQAMGSMGTAMQRDILDREKANLVKLGDKAIEAYATDPNANIGLIEMAFSSAYESGIIPVDELDAAKDKAIDVAINNRYDRMTPEEAIGSIDNDEMAKKYLSFDQREAIKDEAISRKNREMRVFSMQNSTSKSRIEEELAPVFNSATMTRSDAVAKLDSLGYEKGSAPYIHGMAVIDGQYGKPKEGGLSPEQERNSNLLRLQSEKAIEEASDVIDYVKDVEDVKDPRVLSELDAQITILQDYYTQVASSNMPTAKKDELLIDIRAKQEGVLSMISGVAGESLASQAMNTLRTIGDRRTFRDPAEQEIYRNSLLSALKSHPAKYEPIADDAQRTQEFRKIEAMANEQVGLYRNYVGSSEDISKRVAEETSKTKVVTERTPEQRRVLVENSLRSGQSTINNTQEAMMVVEAYMPNATQDVKDAEAARLMAIQPPRQEQQYDPRVPSYSDLFFTGAGEDLSLSDLIRMAYPNKNAADKDLESLRSMIESGALSIFDVLDSSVSSMSEWISKVNRTQAEIDAER